MAEQILDFVSYGVNLGVDEPLLTITVPDSMEGNISGHIDDTSTLQKSRILTANPNDLGISWAIDFRPIGKRRDADNRQEDLSTLSEFLAHRLTHPYIFDETGSEHLAVAFASHRMRFPDGSLGVSAEMQRPQGVEDDVISVLATSVMRRAAVQLKFARRSQINDLVYAHYLTERGLILDTNPLVTCCVLTDGNMYDHDDDKFNLYSQNLHSVDQQLIILAGMITVAESATLVSQLDSFTV